MTCDSLATATPLPGNIDLTETVVHWWSLLSNDKFEAPFLPIMVGDFELLKSDDETFQWMVIFFSAVGTCLVFASALVVRRVSPDKYWPMLQAQLQKLDRFKGEHHGGESDDTASSKVMLGAFFGAAFVLSASALIAILFYNFLEYNFQYAQALAPKDDSIVSSIVSDFEVSVEFVGYTGCINGTADVNLDGIDDTETKIDIEGFVTGSATTYSSHCHCVSETGVYGRGLWLYQGSYFCQQIVRKATINGSPKIKFTAAPECKSCTGSGDYSDWGTGESNKIVECSNCTLANAQAIRWDVWASPMWKETPNKNIYPRKDHNRVNGTLSRADGGVYRGGDATSVVLATIPASCVVLDLS